MEAALHGALAGIVIGLVLTTLEYVLLNRGAAERAAKRKVKNELSDQEKRQFSGVLRFSLLLPFVLGAAGWFVWG